MQAVLDAAVGTGVKVAASARLAVVAGMHLPEEGLAENHGQLGIDDEPVNAWYLRQIRNE